MLSAIAGHEIRDVHFNFIGTGLEPLPAVLTAEQCQAIRVAFTRHGLAMCGLSGTFNAIHPDTALRAELTRRVCLLIERCQDLGAPIVSLCTGTRNPHNMWTGDAANHDQSALDDLCSTLETLLNAATQHKVYLGIEPEPANVIHTAGRARQLLDHFRSPYLKIILDAANLFHDDDVSRMRLVFDEAFELLGSDIVMAHAKEIPRRSDGDRAPGQGLIDWKYFLTKLIASGFQGVLVLHNLEESSVAGGVAYLNQLLTSKLKTEGLITDAVFPSR